MMIEERNLSTTPGVKVSFYVDTTNVTTSGGDSGIVNIEGNKIEYTPNENFIGKELLICRYLKDGEDIILNVTILVGYPFKAKSHILSLLGDELIGSDSLAIFELVKNAYDADAQEVKITFENLNTPEQLIIVEDDGHGMNLETLKNVWLEIGTDFKRGQKRTISKKFNRISLGEKGVGRLAVHKLGRSIKLETQTEYSNVTYQVLLNWQKLMDSYDYINETVVEINKIESSSFAKGKGTRIIISDLKKTAWSRGEFRDLARKVNSMKSPFKDIKGEFNVSIEAGEYSDWLKDIKTTDALLNDSIYYFDFDLKKDDIFEFANLTWSYKFSPPKNLLIKERDESNLEKENEYSKVFNIKVEKEDAFFVKGQKHLKSADLDGIGDITGRFYVYNLQAVVLRYFGQTQAIKNFVKENSGVKIFRDGIRVYNYGEPGDDWLGLDLARVQRLGSHFSKNVTIGSIEISQEGSFQGLKEKTNREGFDENYTYLKFKNICSQIFELFESIAQKDRGNLRDYLEGLKPVKSIGLPETINQLVEKLNEKKLGDELSPLIRRVEKDYNDMRDVMLNSGMTGLNLGIVFHEVDREVKFIDIDLKNNISIEYVKQRVKNLMKLLEDFSPILRQNKQITIFASQLVDRAKKINNSRFIYHNIVFSSPILSKENEDFQISGLGNLLISAMSNIIDNAIYWVGNKKELEGDGYKPAIYIGTDVKGFDGPAIIIADNGNGFNLDPEDLIMPYRTLKPGGMGLGLYFVNLVMEMIGGKLTFPDKVEIEIPNAYNGAIIALVFPKL